MHIVKLVEDVLIKNYYITQYQPLAYISTIIDVPAFDVNACHLCCIKQFTNGGCLVQFVNWSLASICELCMCVCNSFSSYNILPSCDKE